MEILKEALYDLAECEKLVEMCEREIHLFKHLIKLSVGLEDPGC